MKHLERVLSIQQSERKMTFIDFEKIKRLEKLLRKIKFMVSVLTTYKK